MTTAIESNTQAFKIISSLLNGELLTEASKSDIKLAVKIASDFTKLAEQSITVHLRCVELSIDGTVLNYDSHKMPYHYQTYCIAAYTAGLITAKQLQIANLNCYKAAQSEGSKARFKSIIEAADSADWQITSDDESVDGLLVADVISHIK